MEVSFSGKGRCAFHAHIVIGSEEGDQVSDVDDVGTIVMVDILKGKVNHVEHHKGDADTHHKQCT